MKSGGTQPPHRMPCDAVAGKPRYFLGAPFHHCRPGDDAIPIYDNTTVVLDPAGTGEYVAPYPRCIQPGDGGDCDPCADGCSPVLGYWEPPFPDQTFELVYSDVEVKGPVNVGDKVGGGEPYTKIGTPVFGIAQSAVAAGETQTISVQQVEDLKVCHKTGWKAVQAMRHWHGAFDLYDDWNDGWCATPDGGTDLNGNPTYTFSSYPVYRQFPPQVKYLSFGTNITYNYTSSLPSSGNGSSQYTHLHRHENRTVNPLTGEITGTVDEYQDKFNGQYNNGILYESDENIITNGHWTETSWDSDSGITTNTDHGFGAQTDLQLWYGSDDFESDFPLCPPLLAEPTESNDPSIYDWVVSRYNFGQNVQQFNPVTDYNNYAGTASNDDGFGNTVTCSVQWTRSAQGFSWYISLDATSSDGIAEHIDCTGSVALSDENDASGVLSDAIDLLNGWDLSDDLLYPWRTDGNLSVAPLMARNERDANISPIGSNPATLDDYRSPTAGSGTADDPYTAWAQMPWIDPSCWVFVFSDGTTTYPGGGSPTKIAVDLVLLYDGSIIGDPLPEGYENYFDFNFVDWVACLGDDGEGDVEYSWCYWSSGQTLTGPPTNVTHWPNNDQAINKPPGAWMIHGDPVEVFNGGVSGGRGGESEALWIQKYAEILDAWPSQNFARPAGADKFSLDETQVYAVVGLSGSGSGATFTLYEWWDAENYQPVTDVDTSGIWGGASVGGFYDISFDGTYITLGTKIFDLPSDWHGSSNDDAVCFGKLRWPDSPSILGRIAITAVADSAGKQPTDAGWTPSYKFASPQTSFGMDDSAHGESLDFYDANMNLIGTQTCTRMDDSNFTTTAAVSNTAWAMNHGNPAKWYMNDNSPKGDFAVLDWTWDYRTGGEFQRLNGATDCSGAQVPLPTTNLGGGSIDYSFQEFSATQYCLPFTPCSPKVVYFGFAEESFANAQFIQMPTQFQFDEQYGAKWQGYVIPATTGILWQTPHKTYQISGEDLTGDDFDPSTSPLRWEMDNGSCEADTVIYDEDGNATWVSYYAHAPQVECRLTLPDNYGAAQNESPPSPPSDADALGFVSPVTAAGQQPPGYIGFTGDGSPASVDMAFFLHQRFCDDAEGCRFDYSDYPGC